MNRIRIAVVGVGHLGKEHARILSNLPEAELVGIADVNYNQARAIADRCKTNAYESHEDLLGPFCKKACCPARNRIRIVKKIRNIR